MSTKNTTSSASRNIVSIRVKGDAAQAGFRAVRRDLNKDTRQVLLDLATRRVVPRARQSAPSIVADTIVARASSRSVYLTTRARGMKRRIFGLLEFGGTVRGTILHGPNVGALSFSVGGRTVFARYVKTPRKYAAKGFLRKAVDRERRGFMRELDRTLPPIVERRFASGARART